MRIIGGRFRRRRLQTRPGLVTRPITDRVKESLFERYEQQLVDRRVADVFAGTGTLGLEALSRGAVGVVFLEQDRHAVELLRQNVAALGAGEQTLCWRVDVLSTSFRPKGVPHLLPFDFVFCDPPYRMIDDLRSGSRLYDAFGRLARRDAVAGDATLLLRTPAGSEFDLPAVWTRQRTLGYSGMEVHEFRRSAEAVGSTE